MPAVMIPAASRCIPLRRIFVRKLADGRSKGPPNESIRAVMDTDRNTVAGLPEKRRSSPKKMLARSPATRIARMAVRTGRGPNRELFPSSGRRYCSPGSL